MFAYIVIAIELSFLYTVFWYIFIREPKPFHVGENMWGQYEGSKKFSGGQIDPTLPMQARAEWMSLNENLYSDYGDAPASHRSTKLPRISRNPYLQYGWVMDEQADQDMSSRILLGVRKTIEELRLRMSY
ncbi:MAG TPA: hypothetical protein V6C81_17015 [Planktothrix sp.]|jgi:hypothetical protein